MYQPSISMEHRTFTVSQIRAMMEDLRRTEQRGKITINVQKLWLGVKIGLSIVLAPFFSYLWVTVILSLG